MDHGLSDSLVETARRAAGWLMGHRWKLWFWADSIGLEGLLDASATTGDSQYAGYVHGLLKGWLARRGQRSKFDYTAAGVALLRAYELTGDEALLEAAYEHADYLAGFRRTKAGAFVRYEDAAIELPPELPGDHPDAARAAQQARAVADGGPCVFVDNMHFDGPFFARMFQVTGEDRFRRLAIDNLLPSIQLLRDERTGLFYHFWQERTKRPNGVLWGRGNGWAMLGMLHTLEYLPAADPAFETVHAVFTRQAESLAALQDATGDWHTVLDDRHAYLESSIAAFVVDGFSHALRRGWMESRYGQVVERALTALLGHVDDDGRLRGASYETFPSTRVEHYRQMPRDAVVPWGQGPVLTAIRSYQRLTEGAR